MPRRERNDEIAMDNGRVIPWQEQTAVRHAREGHNDALDVGGILDPTGQKLDRERRRRGRGRLQEEVIGGRWTDQEPDAG
jgi:hypothetical protein